MKDFQTELENPSRLKGGLKTYVARTESLGVKNVITTIEREVALAPATVILVNNKSLCI